MARHRWRRLILDVLDETAEGVASPLELRYRRMVELPHRLPDGVRNLHEPGSGVTQAFTETFVICTGG